MHFIYFKIVNTLDNKGTGSPSYIKDLFLLCDTAYDAFVRSTSTIVCSRKDIVAYASLHSAAALATTICAAISLCAAWRNLQRSHRRLQRSLRPRTVAIHSGQFPSRTSKSVSNPATVVRHAADRSGSAERNFAGTNRPRSSTELCQGLYDMNAISLKAFGVIDVLQCDLYNLRHLSENRVLLIDK